jgi:hypothetical protein
MAPTYELIASNTLTADTASVTFSSIPQTYTDLIIISSARYSTGSSVGTINLQFNSDAASNYSYTYLQGDGSSATSGRGSSATIGVSGQGESSSSSAGTFSASICHIQNYANTTTFKTVLTRANSTSSNTQLWVSLWRSTSAVTSVNLIGGYAFAIGSTFTLYGIQAGNA